MNALISATIGTATEDSVPQIHEDGAVAEEAVTDDNVANNTPFVVQKLDFSQESMGKEQKTEEQATQELSDCNVVANLEEISSENGELQSVVDSNLGVLSDFSDKSSTPVGGEIEGLMDEIAACMISVSNVEHEIREYPVRESISDREDLPIILKKIVENCKAKDRRCKDILFCSLQGLASYISYSSNPTQLLNHLHAEINLWLISLFGLPDYTPYLYPDEAAAIVSLVENLLITHYPDMETEGLFALYAKYPVIYMTSHDAVRFASQLCTSLYLPKSVISVVPYNSTTPNSRTIDLKALERLVSDDLSCGKLPLLVLTTVGTEVTGHIDNIPAIKHMCDRHGIWIHATGSCCPLLCLQSPPPTLSVLSECDSISLPCRTILSSISTNTTCLLVTGHLTQQPTLQLVLPPWVLLQEEGPLNIRNQIQNSYNTAVQLYNELRNIESIQVLEYPLTGHVVCFRYYTQLDGIPDLSEETPMNSLMSKLTKIIYDDVKLVVENIELVQFCGDVDVIRIAPLSAPSLTLAEIPALAAVVQRNVAVFENSLRLRDQFNREIQSRENFLLLLDPQHPSVGAFQYLPKYLQDEETCNTAEGREELNEVNGKIADYLAQKWEILTTRTVADFIVISIPLVPDVVDIGSLLDDIVSAAPNFENNSKYLARMSEIIRKGIEQANEELQEETDAQFYDKGIMRQIPLFGPVLNWMSPIEDKKIVGRSFSLYSGEIHPSHSVYNSTVGSPHRSRTTSSASSISDRGFPKVHIES